MHNKPHSEKTKRKISLANKGRKHSEEWKRQMSKKFKGNKNPFFNKQHTIESKQKISKKLMGRISWCKGLKGIHFSPNTEIKKGQHVSPKTEFKKGQHISPKTEFKKAENHIQWKGGRFKNAQGYILIYKPEHPFVQNNHYIFEHRLIIEKQIGRYLLPNEPCHHLNNIKDDNRPENLMAFIKNSIHTKFHKNPLNVKLKEIIFDGRNFH